MGALGMVSVKVNGATYRAKGDFTFALGGKKNTTIMGPTGPTGYKVEHVVSYVAGKVAFDTTIDLKDFMNIKGATVDLELEMGTIITWKDAFYAGDRSVTVQEGEIDFRMESESDGEQI